MEDWYYSIGLIKVENGDSPKRSLVKTLKINTMKKFVTKNKFVVLFIIASFYFLFQQGASFNDYLSMTFISVVIILWRIYVVPFYRKAIKEGKEQDKKKEEEERRQDNFHEKLENEIRNMEEDIFKREIKIRKLEKKLGYKICPKCMEKVNLYASKCPHCTSNISM